MAYNPTNVQAYTAAYSGAVAGMAASGWMVNPSPAGYTQVTAIAGAFAQAFDQIWNNGTTLNGLEYNAIVAIVSQDFAARGPGPLENPKFQTVSNWLVAAKACAAAVLQSDAYFAGQGITPPGTYLQVEINGNALPAEPFLDLEGGIQGVRANTNIAFLWSGPAIQVNPGDNLQLTAGQRVAETHTLIGPCTVSVPADQNTFPCMDIVVTDPDGNATVNPILVADGSGRTTIEDPASPGTYAPSVTLAANSNFAITWRLLSTNRWKVIASYHYP